MDDLGVLGARSFLGRALLNRPEIAHRHVHAFSRAAGEHIPAPRVSWHTLVPDDTAAYEPIHTWISLVPIFALPDLLPWLERRGVRRLVVLSSTSLFAKADSGDASERMLSQAIAKSEKQVVGWAQARGIAWIILRPTLLYGYGMDRNVAQIARLVRRLKFFPVCGPASGLRQPVHAEDVAQACLAALSLREAGVALQLSGGEVLSFRQMVERICHVQGLRPRIVPLPLVIWRLVSALTRLIRGPSLLGVALRMNTDQIFPHDEASRLLDFRPRRFMPALDDLRASSG